MKRDGDALHLVYGDVWTDRIFHLEAPLRGRAIPRNAGTNPVSYSHSSPPVLGTDYRCDVDLAGTTGHNLALLVGYASPLTATLGGGQVLLVDVTDPGGELLAQPPVAGPLAHYDIPVPADLHLLGLQVATQAAHVGGIRPFALSNALDLTVGWY
jgi:hypothetical protein